MYVVAPRDVLVSFKDAKSIASFETSVTKKFHEAVASLAFFRVLVVLQEMQKFSRQKTKYL